jgi:anti-anti-sigma factor
MSAARAREVVLSSAPSRRESERLVEMSAFSIIGADPRDGSRRLEVVGELDLAVADRLRAAIEAVDPGVELVVVDLARCEFLDSTGLAVILGAREQLEESGRRLMVSSPTRQVERVLAITGLLDDGLVLDRGGEEGER